MMFLSSIRYQRRKRQAELTPAELELIEKNKESA